MSHLEGKQRATNDQEKSQRRAAILQVAEKVFLAEPYEKITMAQVARETGLAKGTLYLYFRSKEALVLALLEKEWELWVERALELMPSDLDLPVVADSFVVSLLERKLFYRLAPLIQPVLEKNIDHDALVSYKSMVAEVIKKASLGLAKAIPQKDPASYKDFLLRMYAHFLGLRQMEPVSPEHRVVLENLGLEFLEVDFKKEFTSVLRIFLMELSEA